MSELLELKCLYPDAKLVVGNSEIGIDMKFKKETYNAMINTSKVYRDTPAKFYQSSFSLVSSFSFKRFRN